MTIAALRRAHGRPGVGGRRTAGGPLALVPVGRRTRRVLAPLLAERTKEELSRTFWDLRIPFQPIHSIDEIASSEHLEARDFWVDVDHPVAGRYRALGAPYRLSATPWRLERPAPRLGEHNDEVAAEVAPPAPASAAATTTTEATCRCRGCACSTTGTSGRARCWARCLRTSRRGDQGARAGPHLGHRHGRSLRHEHAG